MENPFRSEAAAYRFLLVTIGALALIVAAKLLLGSVAALIVFVLELAAVVAYYVRQRSERPEPMTADHVGAPDEKRILVIANETVGGTALRNEIARRWDPRWSRMAEAMQELRPVVVARQDLHERRRRQIFSELATQEALNVLADGGTDALRAWLAARFPELSQP